ncbi:MAG: hypothetical protein HC838_03805 [Spirulinaceae cyanobacterium RM2_2_10]|nr:hypothetical protein [Spirulinaceae cyanobacterium RM2_2_10]
MEITVGAHPYYYFTGYREDVNDALQALRKAEFAAGRYDPAMQAYDDSYMFEFQFPPDIDSVAQGRSILN